MNKPYVKLQPTEAVIVQSAAEILSAYIIAGQCTPDNEDEYLKKSVKQAIRIVQITDESVQADKEVM